MFGNGEIAKLKEAASHFEWLLSRGYAGESSLKLVGDRFSLCKRQRTAVARCTCGPNSRALRQSKRAEPSEMAGQSLLIDGYNVLTTVEAALGGAIILVARDGCARDMASMHGSYRKVEETVPAVEKIGRALERLGVGACTWYLDSPVSNSGRLKAVITSISKEKGWPWLVELVPNPDPILVRAEEIVATADSAVLDRCRRWLNLARIAIEDQVPQTNWVNLFPS